MLDIYIDADACPVKDEALQVAYRHDLTVYIVSNSWLRMNVGEKVHRIVVTDGFDAADNWIVDRAGLNDIVITADILLAGRVLKNEAYAVSPTGKIFNQENIGATVAMRNLSAHLRETGEITSHHKSFSQKDKSSFLQAFEQVIQLCKRQR